MTELVDKDIQIVLITVQVIWGGLFYLKDTGAGKHRFGIFHLVYYCQEFTSHPAGQR